MDNLISVVVPIYNSEKYLNYCLSSIVKQSFSNYEVILVDDGSADNSKTIYDEYLLKFKNFRVIKTSNKGVSNARNIGINEAKGKFICFLDSDDWLPKHSLEVLLDVISKNDADISWGSIKTIWPHINKVIKVKNSVYTINKKNNFVNDVYMIHESSCSRLYKVDIIKNNNIRFVDDVKNGEDAIFIHDYLFFSNKIATSSKVVYCYNKLENNTAVSKYYNEFGYWRKKEFESRLKAYKKWSVNDEQYKELAANRLNFYIDEIIDYYCRNFDYNNPILIDSLNFLFNYAKSQGISVNDESLRIFENIKTIDKLILDKKVKNNNKLIEYIKNLLRKIRSIRYSK